MKQYKGYYIDHFYFNSTADIDEFIKEQTIQKYIVFCEMFAKKPCMELIAIMTSYEEKLHREFGLSYSEIEALELSVYA